MDVAARDRDSDDRESDWREREPDDVELESPPPGTRVTALLQAALLDDAKDRVELLSCGASGG